MADSQEHQREKSLGRARSDVSFRSLASFLRSYSEHRDCKALARCPVRRRAAGGKWFFITMSIFPTCITPDDFEKIEAEMLAIVKENQVFERIEVSREDALCWQRPVVSPRSPSALSRASLRLTSSVTSLGGEAISIYKNGDFWDSLCGTARSSHRQLQGFQNHECRERLLQGRCVESPVAEGLRNRV